MRDGYGSGAPSDHELAAIVRVEELTALGWLMQFSTPEYPDRTRAFQERRCIIDDPSAETDPWVHTGNPSILDVSRVRP